MDAENYLRLLNNSDVEKKFHDMFKPLIELTVSEFMKPMKLLVDNRMSELTITIKNLEANILARDGKIAMLEKTNSELHASLNAAVAKCDEMEQYSKRENLIISGIPASVAEVAASSDSHSYAVESSETILTKVVSLCSNKLGVTLSPSDVSIAHRLKTGAVMVRFVRRSARDAVFYAKGKLRDHNKSLDQSARYYINEDLSATNRKLFAAARDQLKKSHLKSVWTANCRIFARDNNDVKHLLSTYEDLRVMCRLTA